MAKVLTRGGLELRGRRGRDRRGRRAGHRTRAARRVGDRRARRRALLLAAGELCPRRVSRRVTSANTSRSSTAEHVRIEHWDVAFNHGKTAALNMLGRDVAHEVVPYFYSVLGGLGRTRVRRSRLRVGRGDRARVATRTVSFTTWYLREGRVMAALTFGRSDDLEHARRLIAGAQTLGEQRQRKALARPGQRPGGRRWE